MTFSRSSYVPCRTEVLEKKPFAQSTDERPIKIAVVPDVIVRDLR